MSDFLLTQLINYGAPLFGLALFLAALGVPLSTSLLVIAMGAFAQQGILSWPVMVVVGLVGVVSGDALSYGMGHFAGVKLEGRFGASPKWKSARGTFDKHGAKAVFLTRFLLTAIATPTNLIAGGSGFGLGRFLVYDISGEFIWLVLYSGLGYLFGGQWEAVSEFVSDFGWFLLGIVLLALGFAWARRVFKGPRTGRQS
ncbi:MAG: VTT domain-containing protein [Chloroflexota bacterium]